MSRKAVFFFTLAALAMTAPAFAIDRVAPGFDSWVTPAGGGTYYDFSAHPIPAGFFCPGSAAFTGRIEFQGVPIKGAEGADTIVERVDEAVFDKAGLASTRVQVRGLSLVGTAPIATSCGQFRVSARLADGVQPLTAMKIQKDGEDSGFFESHLALRVLVTFEPLAGGKALHLEDTVNFDRPTVAPWIALPQNDGTAKVAVFDLNGDGKAETRMAGSSVFFAGTAGDGLKLVTSHCATYSGTVCTEYHVVDPCECCNLCRGCACP